ncbi:13798_t:CDS:2, partial [Racocetra fulgida]
MPKAKSNTAYYKPSQEEILATRTDTIPTNTKKSIDKWVQILQNWHHTVGYDYGIETINNKDQLKTEMTEFILEIRQIKNSAEYAPSSLINCINLLSLYLLNHPNGNQQFTLSNKKEFSRLGEKSCQSFMKNVCNIAGIDIKNHSITNHSGRSTSITALFRKGVPMITTMALTGHKSEASYRVYARPSGKEKEDALSTLINHIKLPLKHDDENLSSTVSELSKKVLNDSVKNWNSVTRPFHAPLKNINQRLNLSPYINAMKYNPTL